MVAHVKLIGAIMVTLFAMGFQAEAALSDLYWMCQKLDSKLSSSPGIDQLNPKAIMALAESHIGWFNKNMGKDLIEAWSTVVGGSDCGESSLQSVLTIADCSPGSGFGNLREATKEYARKCLGQDFWRNKIVANSEKKDCSGGEKLKTFINREFLLDYREKMKNCLHVQRQSLEYCSSTTITLSLATAVIGDLKENIDKVNCRKDVQAYLNNRLYKNCSCLNLSATAQTLDEIKAMEAYIGQYEKVVSSLDDSAQEDIVRYSICQNVKKGEYQMAQGVWWDMEKLMK